MSETKTYTATDIERYHSGTLPAAERHAMEKAALNDAFLADALEGYATAQTPANDLNTLRQKLQLRIEKDKKRRGLFSIGNNWMKVAALFILIALGGWLVLQTVGGNKTKLATTEALPQKTAGVRTAPASDSAMVSSDVPLKKSPLAATEKQDKQTTVAKNNRTIRKERAVKDKMPAGRVPGLSLVSDSTANQGYVALTATPPAAPKAEAFFKKSTADAMNKEKQNVAITADSLRNSTVAMQRNDARLQEVVVVGYGNKKRARQTNVAVDSLEPVDGWTNFNDYVAGHLQEPEDVKEKGLQGEVELSFEVNKEGEPVNIAVTQSLCGPCDEEAVRILKEGPKWKPANKKGKLKIKFPAR